MGDLADFLAVHAIPASDIERAEADGTLELLALEHLLQEEPPRYDVDEIAERAHVPPVKLRQLWRAMGFPDPGPHDRTFTDADVEALRLAGERVHDAERFDRTVQLLRVSSSSLARMAEASADDVADQVMHLRAAGLGSREIAAAVLDESELERVRALVWYMYRLQLLAALRRRLAVADRPAELQTQLSVGFADLVGFTALSQELETGELATMVSEFEGRAYGTVAQEGGRVVKTIGDEVMFSTPSPAAAVRIALRLTGDERRGPLMPDVRAGVAVGPVLARWGDEFGPVVNLASRLVNIALPGTVLVSHEVHAALRDEPGLAWRSLRPRRLKGIGRVPTWVVRPARRA